VEKLHIFQFFLSKERRLGRIEPDAFGAVDLPEVLPRGVEVVVDLSGGGRNQHAAYSGRTSSGGQASGVNFLVDFVQESLECRIDLVGVQQVDPEPPLLDLVQNRGADSGTTVEFALLP
jgi:hypothetical protein